MGHSLRDIDTSLKQDTLLQQRPDVSDTARQATSPMPSLSELSQEAEQGPGPFGTVAKRIEGLYKFWKVNLGAGTPEDYQWYASRLKEAKEQDYLRGGRGPEDLAKRVLHSLAYWGKTGAQVLTNHNPFMESDTPIQQTISHVFSKEGAEGLAAMPFDFATSIVAKPIEAMSGFNLEDDLHALTPEERNQAGLDAVANIAMLATGSAVEGSLEKAAVGRGVRAIDASEGVLGAKNAGLAAVRGGTKKAIGRGVVAAGASGGVYAGISTLGKDDALDQILINGVMFAPLGAGLELMKLGKERLHPGSPTVRDPASQKIVQHAADVMHTRQVQITEKDSFGGVVFKLDALKNADNIAQAIVQGNLRAYPDKPVVVPGISRDQLGRVISSLAGGETKIAPHFYERPDGLFDMMVTSEPVGARSARSFRESGLVPNQLVEHEGRTYRFRGLSKDGDKVLLTNNGSGRSIIRDREGLRPRTDIEMHDVTPETAGDMLWDNFRRYAIADAQGKPTPAAIDNVEPPTPGEPTPPPPSSLGQRFKAGIGRFIRSEEGTLRMTGTDEELLYSRVERGIDSAPFKKGQGSQWLGHLTKNSPQFEREWTDLDSWLKENADTVLTADQVKQKWAENQIHISEVQYGGPEYQKASDAYKGAREAYEAHVQDMETKYGYYDFSSKWTPEERDKYHALRKASYDAADARSNVNAPKFDDPDYNEPGGSNYRSIVLTLDPTAKTQGEYVNPGHFPESNILVWARLRDYVLPNGEKLTYVDEVQTDWIQAARKEGFRKDAPDTAVEAAKIQAELHAKLNERNDLYEPQRVAHDAYWSYYDAHNDLENTYRGPEGTHERHLPQEERDKLAIDRIEYRAKLKELYAEVEKYDKKINDLTLEIDVLRTKESELHLSKGVANSPFKTTKDAQLLMLKRIIAEAAHSGSDRIAFTDPMRQYQRWGSEYIRWKDNGNGSLDIDYSSQSTTPPSRINDPRAALNEWDNYSVEGVSPSDHAQLESIVNRTVRRDKRPTVLAKLKERIKENPDFGTVMPRFEGMTGSYGAVLENTLKDYGKKLGIKVQLEPVVIPEIARNAARLGEVGRGEIEDALEQGHDINDIERDRTAYERDRQEQRRREPPVTVRSMRMPPELRAQVIRDKQPLGKASPAVVAGLGAAGVGGLVGGTIGNTPEERERNAVLGAFAGAGALAAPFTRRGREFIRSEEGSFKLPEWAKGPPDEKLLNATPRSSFREVLDKFAKDRGFNESEKAVLEAEMTQRLFRETFKSLPPEEQEVIARMNQEVEGLVSKPGGSRLEQAQIAAKAAAKEVVNKANSNGMFVDEEAAGNLVLRDNLSNKIVGRFKTTHDALEFIDKSGQAHGIDLDSGGGIPTRIGSGLMPIDEPDPSGYMPYAVLPNDKMGALTNMVNTVFDWATPNRNIMTSLDSTYGTRFFARIYDTLQVARMKANAAIRPWYEKLSKIDKVANKLSKGEREIVDGWLQTKSPSELMADMNRTEIAIAKHFADKNIDLKQVVEYVKQLERLQIDVDKGRMTPEDMAIYGKKLAEEIGLNDEHIEATGLVRAVRDGRDGFFAPIARLTNAILNNDLSRADYAKLHGMNGHQLALGHGLEALHTELARAFNIPDVHRFQDLMAHARLYTEGDLVTALDDFNVPPTVKDFYSALSRTGEVSSYEKDPVRSMQRYIKAGFDSKLMQPALEGARQALPEELAKLSDQSRGKAERVVKRYMDDVRGIPGEASKFTQEAVNIFAQKLGLKIPIDVRKNIVNLILATGEAALQGFRVVAGIRDFTQGVSWYYSRFGLERTLKMLEYGTKGLDGITKADLHAGGLIPELNVIYIDSPTEFTGTTLGRASNVIGNTIRAVSQMGLRMSLQKDVYALMHAGSYLDTWKLAGDELGKMVRGETTREKAYRKLSLDTYEMPTVIEFDRLVGNQKLDEAARLLARETGREQVGVFGSGNNPGGWNRNIGRIAGQYGSWSMWFRAQGMRMMSRGTNGQRMAALTRLAATQGAVYAAGAATGLSFANWYAPAGVLFTGGPLVDAAGTVNDAIQGRGYIQDLAIERLKRYLPYDPWGDEFNIKQIYVPGSYFINDLKEAMEMAQDNDPLALPRALGVKPAQ